MHSWRDIPDTFKLKGRTWVVVWVNDLRQPGTGKLADGVCMRNDGIIALDKRIRRQPRNLWRTWVHELCHILLWTAPVDGNLEEHLIGDHLELLADVVCR